MAYADMEQAMSNALDWIKRDNAPVTIVESIRYPGSYYAYPLVKWNNDTYARKEYTHLKTVLPGEIVLEKEP